MAHEIRDLFDVPADLAYFNCAAVGPLPRAAQAEIEAAARRRMHPWTITNADWLDSVEERRALFAALAGADPDAIALVPAASYGMAVAARNLAAKPGQRVLILADDFPSDVYTWRRFAARTGCDILTIARKREESWTDAVLAALDERVAIVAIPNVHWTDGALIDLVRVGARVREAGAALVVDASQSFGAMPLDLAAVRPDFMVAVGYKWLLGPLGLGYLYVAEAHRGGEPLEENWLSRVRSEDFARLVDYQEDYRPGARRFDMGQKSAFETNRAATASLRLFEAWGIETVARTLEQVTDRIAAEARALGLAISSEPARSPHLIGLELPPAAAGRAAAIFLDHNVHVGFRGNAVRIAPHMYTTDADVDRLAAALAALA